MVPAYPGQVNSNLGLGIRVTHEPFPSNISTFISDVFVNGNQKLRPAASAWTAHSESERKRIFQFLLSSGIEGILSTD